MRFALPFNSALRNSLYHIIQTRAVRLPTRAECKFGSLAFALLWPESGYIGSKSGDNRISAKTQRFEHPVLKHYQVSRRPVAELRL
jgi:hypothetical protein